MSVRVTYVPQSNDFALYHEDFLVDKCRTEILVPCDTKIKLISYVSQCYLYVMAQCVCPIA